jgi:predicted phage-related endonuclease
MGPPKAVIYANRQHFIGGSDARIIMGSDEPALIRLWREKRGEVPPEDLSGNLIVQLGKVTEDLNPSWYERNTRRTVVDVQRLVKHSAIPWMAATLDGIVEGIGAVFEAKFMLPWSFSEEAAAEKYMARSSTICGSLIAERQCCRSSPAAANGLRSRSPWILST